MELVVPFGRFDDRIAARFNPNGKLDRTATDRAILRKALTRTRRRIDAHVTFLPTIRADVGSIVFQRHLTLAFAIVELRKILDA